MWLISPISFMLAVQVIDKSGPGKIHEVILVLFRFPIYILYFGIYYYMIVVKCYFSIKTS